MCIRDSAYVVRDADGNPTGNVYFDVASWPHYGELTHQKQTAVSDAASEVTDAMGPVSYTHLVRPPTWPNIMAWISRQWCAPYSSKW